MALVPLLIALIDRSPDARSLDGKSASRSWLHPFNLGLTSGVVYFAGTVYWVGDVMVTFGGLAEPVSVLVTALLVAFLALFPALFALGVHALRVQMGRVAVWLSPAVWVATELGRTYFLTGFPWVLVGYSQVTVLPIAQLASVFGVYGLSGLVGLVNAACANVFVASGRRRFVTAAIVVSLVAGSAAWGSLRLSRSALTGQGTPVRVGLIQGNIAQEDKWKASSSRSILEQYLTLTRQALGRGARFVVWPESSTPFYFEENPAEAETIRSTARAGQAYLLFGSDQLERGSPAKYYNAAFLVKPDGQTAAVYRKMHLVPFGEYVPLKRLLFFASPLVESVSDFSAGDRALVLPIGAHAASTAICYEVVFPGLMRQFVLNGSELLTTITNDAWYGRSSAPFQHFAQASMRAIEQGRYLLRAANTGVSGIVDPYGRVVASTSIFEQAVVVGDVRFLTGRTVYGVIGDLFAHICAILTVAALLASWRVRRLGRLPND